jgi:hypothetical protein
MMELLEEWHATTNDTASLKPAIVLPLEYDYIKL